jgi:hypothetical protein
VGKSCVNAQHDLVHWILRETPESFREGFRPDTEKERCTRQEEKRRMNPILGPRDLKKGCGFKLQTQWSVGETHVSPLLMSLTWGCQWLVRSGVSLCF